MSDPFDLDDLDAEPPAMLPVAASLPSAPATPPPAWLASLNPSQYEAVTTLDGPLLVLAGAGTGKTRVLTSRLGLILAQRRAYPSQILAVTFTNKAAREMRERVERLVGASSEGLWLGTFHAISARILRRHAETVGLKPTFTILDTDDQLRLIKQLAEAEHLDDKRWPARAIGAIFDRWKDKGYTPDKLPRSEGGAIEGRGPSLYRTYCERLRSLNACDFGDLLLHNLTLFTSYPDILAQYQRRFRYILVDEYQDSNVAQYLWLRLLAQSHRNICCVGDDDQSVYGWRGAEVGNILRFETDFPGARIVRLERNYRSTPHILGAASQLIARNESRLGKTLWTEIKQGEKVIVRGVWDGDEEARWVGDEIEALQRRGESLNTMAILVRAGHQTRAFEERFVTLGLRYRVIGGLRFYERREIRDAIAYLRVIRSEDDDLAFERIVNVPRRGLGDTTIQQVHKLARARSVSLVAAARDLVATDELRGKARTALTVLLRDFDRWRGLSGTINHIELVEQVLDESGYTQMWQSDKSPEAPGRLENLKELINALQGFENLAGFLEHVSLVMDEETDDNEPMVSLMTLHAAKGLEFDTVFLPGWEEELFPSRRTLEENGTAGLEEERRLAYVGITRARKRCYISFAANRRIFNQWVNAMPSRFIDELPVEHVEHQASQGVFGSGFQERRVAIDDDIPFDDVPSLGSRAKKGGFARGQRVFHDKFGYGRIVDASGHHLTIAFDKAGEKKVIDSYVKPA